MSIVDHDPRCRRCGTGETRRGTYKGDIVLRCATCEAILVRAIGSER